MLLKKIKHQVAAVAGTSPAIFLTCHAAMLESIFCQEHNVSMRVTYFGFLRQILDANLFSQLFPGCEDFCDKSRVFLKWLRCKSSRFRSDYTTQCFPVGYKSFGSLALSEQLTRLSACKVQFRD